MAGVKIPQLQRLAPVQPVSPGRLQVSLPSPTAGVAARTQAVSGLAVETINTFNRVEKQEAEIFSNSADNEFQLRAKRILVGDDKTPGIKFKKGDPTPLYRSYDEAREKIIDELSSKPDQSQNVRTAIRNRLLKTNSVLEMQSLTEYGNQQNKYDQGIINSTVGLAKRQLVEDTSQIIVGDEGSFKSFIDSLSKINNIHIAGAIRSGVTVENPEGKSSYTDDEGNEIRVDLDPTTDLRIKIDRSEGISDAVEVLIASREIGKAEALIKKYDKEIDPITRSKINKKLEKAISTKNAFQVVNKLQGKSLAEKNEILNKLPIAERIEALKVQNTLTKQQDLLMKQSNDSNFNTLMLKVQERQNSKNPYNTLTQAESDAEFELLLDRVTDAKDKQAVRDAIEQPKESTDFAKNRMDDLFFGRDPNFQFTTIPNVQFQRYLSGFDPSDRTFWERKRITFLGETGAQEHTRFKHAGADLRNQLNALKVIRINRFNRLSVKDRRKFTEINNRFIEELDKRPDVKGVKALSDFAKSFALSIKNLEEFIPPEVVRFRGGSQKTIIKPAPKTNSEWARDFILEKQRVPKNPAELNKFIEEKQGK